MEASGVRSRARPMHFDRKPPSEALTAIWVESCRGSRPFTRVEAAVIVAGAACRSIP